MVQTAALIHMVQAAALIHMAQAGSCSNPQGSDSFKDFPHLFKFFPICPKRSHRTMFTDHAPRELGSFQGLQFSAFLVSSFLAITVYKKTV
jgi:hypothetical protein